MRLPSAAALALLAALVLAPAASAALKPADVGVIIAENFDRPAPDRKIGEIEAGAASDLGAGWGSIYVSWNALQPDAPTSSGPGSLAGHVAAQYLDRFASLKERGLKVNVTFVHTPRWASGTSDPDAQRALYYEPADPASFGNFAAAFAERFKAEVDGYEIFNEPDGGVFWLPGPNPARYAAVAKVATQMIKQHDDVGDNKVFVGATVGANDEFMEEVLGRHGLKDSPYDAVAFHSGTGCKTDSPDAYLREETGTADIHNNNSTAYREMVFMMRSLGIQNPVVADTAAGWATMPAENSCNVAGPHQWKKPGGVTEELQAQYLKDYLGCALQDEELAYVFIFSLYDMADQTKWDQRMGLRYADRTPKESFRQLSTVLKSGTIPPFGRGFCGGYVDHEAPTAQITTTAPVVGGVPVFSGALPLSASGTDEHPIKAVRIAVDGKNIPGTTTRGTMSLEWQGAKALKLGEHTVTATVEDEAGNIAQAAPLKVKKVTPAQMPRTKTRLTAKVKRKRGRKVTIAGRLSWPTKGLIRPTGRIRIWFKKGRFVSKYGVSPLPRSANVTSKSFTKTAKLRKPGKWQVRVFYDAKAPYRGSKARTFYVKVR